MANRKILFAVDLQKDFIDGTLTVPGAASVLPVIDSVKGRFDLVYFTLDWHPVNHCSFREQGGPWPVHCVHHTAGASLPDSVLAGLEEERMRFILKGRRPEREEYGARLESLADFVEGRDEVVVDYFERFFARVDLFSHGFCGPSRDTALDGFGEGECSACGSVFLRAC